MCIPGKKLQDENCYLYLFFSVEFFSLPHGSAKKTTIFRE